MACAVKCITHEPKSHSVLPSPTRLPAIAAAAGAQDIAVDGWALTLLPPHHIEYASTCQTLGMNTGYFMSFTIFLALSSTEFCNKYIRSSRLAGEVGRRGPPGEQGKQGRWPERQAP